MTVISKSIYDKYFTHLQMFKATSILRQLEMLSILGQIKVLIQLSYKCEVFPILVIKQNLRMPILVRV